MAQTTMTRPITAASTPKPGENTWLWLLKLVTGPLIFVLILIHFVVNHLVAEAGLLSYREILIYYQVGIVPIMEGVFLALVIVHSLLGLRSILLDLNPSTALMKVADGIFVLGGTVALVYGIWLIQVIVNRGLGS